MPEFDPLEMSFESFDTTEPEEEQTPAAEPDTTGTEQPDSEAVAEEEAPVEETETEPEAQSDGDDSLLDEELRELGFPPLPPEVASDPAVLKRYLETQRGVKQMVESLRPYHKYVEALNDPATQAAAFDALFQTTGYRPPGYTPEQETEPEPVQTSTPEFEYEGERLAYEMAMAEAERRYGHLREYEPLLKQLAEQQTTVQADREFATKVDKEAPSVIGYFGKAEGFSVTKEMVAKAMREHPTADVIQAVKMSHLDAFVAHKAGKPLKKGPEMPSGGGSSAKGMALPDIAPEDYADLTAAQVLAVQQLLPDD